jgi:outer membrane murein-binding lipoprotein Lpp
MYSDKVDKTQKEMQERIVSNFKKGMANEEKINDVKGLTDNLRGKIDKLFSKVETFTVRFQAKIDKISDGVDTKIKALKGTIDTESENVASQFEKNNKF